MKRQDNLKAVVTRYIGILNSQNLLSVDKVAELIVSMLSDLETTIGEEMFQIANEVDMLSTRTLGIENKLRSVEGDTLGQVVRYVIGESLAKPGGLPADIERLVASSQKVEKGILNLSSELVHLIDRVDKLEKSESDRVDRMNFLEKAEKESNGKLHLRRNPMSFFVFIILVTSILALILML